MKIAFLNRERALQELVACAQTLLERDERVLAVGLFGSLARDEALPSSDADVLIVLKSHPTSPWFERIAEYMDAFDESTLPVEPFAYTMDELERLAARSGFLYTALTELIHLSGDPRVWEELQALSG